MAVRLRAHHLLCMLTFVGEGYSPEFVANFRRLVERLGRDDDVGEEIEIVDGPDDVCAPLLCAPDCHCVKPGPATRDRLAVEQVSALLGLPVGPGARLRLSAERVASLRAAFAQGSIRAACEGCQWKSLCDRIAEGWGQTH